MSVTITINQPEPRTVRLDEIEIGQRFQWVNEELKDHRHKIKCFSCMGSKSDGRLWYRVGDELYQSIHNNYVAPLDESGEPVGVEYEEKRIDLLSPGDWFIHKDRKAFVVSRDDRSTYVRDYSDGKLYPLFNDWLVVPCDLVGELTPRVTGGE